MTGSHEFSGWYEDDVGHNGKTTSGWLAAPKLLDLDPTELLPFDMLDEGRRIKQIDFYADGRIEAWAGMLVGVETDGPPGWIRPEWDVDLVSFDPNVKVRVARGVPVPVRRLHEHVGSAA